jgi:hypothetical protein
MCCNWITESSFNIWCGGNGMERTTITAMIAYILRDSGFMAVMPSWWYFS